MDIAVVGAGIDVTLDASGVCTDARVVLGAVAPTAILVPEAATVLIGRKLDQAARVVAELERRSGRADTIMLDNDTRPERVVVRVR